jgi:rare lipoprotein A
MNKLSFILSITLILITGCTKTIYSSKIYQSYQSTYTSISPQKVRDSKAMHRATMRPYTVRGKRYYPTTVRIGQKFDGIASWYGPNFHAKKTSNGEIYNMYANTAAHKTLPMNTMVKVYNKENGRSTIVRINDRGPFVGTRIIDLSNTAAHTINMVKKGTARVQLTILGFHGKIARTAQQRDEVMSVGKYYVQVGAFSKYNGALITQRKFKNLISSRYNVIIRRNGDDKLNRVWIGGFRSETETINFKEENGLQGAMIIAQ